MCRFMVYKGNDSILLSKLITEPSHSVLNQSFDSRLRLDHRRPHNGDGFGVGYYTDPKLGAEPCIFTSTIPAWNCINLQRIAAKTTSRLIFAHVRATTEGNLSDQNCHPFSCGSLMFMHNGGIGGWTHVKRKFAFAIDERWFLGVQGSTDSEWAFALFLDRLSKLGKNPEADPGPGGFGHDILRKALLATIAVINEFTASVADEYGGKAPASLLNFAIADGHSVVCSRYVSSKTDSPASLSWSSGTSWKAPTTEAEKGLYKMERRDRGADIVLVASEPLTFEKNNWVQVPTNSTLTIHKQNVLVHPIVDQFSVPIPEHKRDNKLAEEMGQASTRSDSATPDLMMDTSAQPNANLGVLARKLQDLKTDEVQSSQLLST